MNARRTSVERGTEVEMRNGEMRNALRAMFT